jgi:hypothetical protein
MDQEDPLRMETQEDLQQLLRLYSQLDDVLLEASEWESAAETRERVAPLLARTITQQRSLMASVQRGIEDTVVA